MNDDGSHNDNQTPPDRKLPDPTARPPIFNLTTILVVMTVVLLMAYLIRSQYTEKRESIEWGFFVQQLEGESPAEDEENAETEGEAEGELTLGNIKSVNFEGKTVTGEFKEPPMRIDDPNTDEDESKEQMLPKFTTEAPDDIPPVVSELLQKNVGPSYSITPVRDRTSWVIVFYVVIMLTVGVATWIMIRRMNDKMTGGGPAAGFGRSPAKRYTALDNPTTFEDVAGIDNVVAELEELVDYLKDPAKFVRMGARVPKGVLFMGPPGTGKTLLARALAGEADVPFFSVNGSEFIQMYVGVGASRVRDLFGTAKAQAPSILFIDEIDAVGRLRGTGVGGGSDEREQTLNQILSEMDGFNPTQSVIVVAATNRPDVLDPALLRPGRFDRHVMVDRPAYRGRLAIFKVHSKNVPLADDVDMDSLAAGTVGMTGADIQGLVNEATLWATRQNKDQVEMSDFEQARDNILMGSKREEMLTDEEKRMTAYHEAGHALIAWLQPENDRVHKVSIIPRGRALGVTHILPEEDQVHISEASLYATLNFILGGRAAERLVFKQWSAGAENDLQQATKIARSMISRWGMSERLGPVAFRTSEHPFLGKEMAEVRQFSEHTAQVIDEEIVRILREAHDRAAEILERERDKLDTLAQALETDEELSAEDIAKLIGPAAQGPRKVHRIGGIDRPNKPEKDDEEKSDEKSDDSVQDSPAINEGLSKDEPGYQ
jgi:cell division protease FtsH